jgi:hypothetical protein
MRLQPQKQAPTQQKPASNTPDEPPRLIRDILPPHPRRPLDPAGQEQLFLRRRTQPAATGNPKNDFPYFSHRNFLLPGSFFFRKTSLTNRLDGWAESSNLSSRPPATRTAPTRKIPKLIDVPRPLFELGKTIATPAALEAMQAADINPSDLLKRHVTGDYGDICDEDGGLNDIAIKEGTRILSVYKVTDELTIWIITEADRSSTCMLLPDEY